MQNRIEKRQEGERWGNQERVRERGRERWWLEIGLQNLTRVNVSRIASIKCAYACRMLTCIIAQKRFQPHPEYKYVVLRERRAKKATQLHWVKINTPWYSRGHYEEIAQESHLLANLRFWLCARDVVFHRTKSHNPNDCCLIIELIQMDGTHVFRLQYTRTHQSTCASWGRYHERYGGRKKEGERVKIRQEALEMARGGQKE